MILKEQDFEQLMGLVCADLDIKEQNVTIVTLGLLANIVTYVKTVFIKYMLTVEVRRP